MPGISGGGQAQAAGLQGGLNQANQSVAQILQILSAAKTQESERAFRLEELQLRRDQLAGDNAARSRKLDIQERSFELQSLLVNAQLLEKGIDPETGQLLTKEGGPAAAAVDEPLTGLTARKKVGKFLEDVPGSIGAAGVEVASFLTGQTPEEITDPVIGALRPLAEEIEGTPSRKGSGLLPLLGPLGGIIAGLRGGGQQRLSGLNPQAVEAHIQRILASPATPEEKIQAISSFLDITPDEVIAQFGQALGR